MEQEGHCTCSPHFMQRVRVLKPRRFRNKIACSFLSSVSRMASSSAKESIGRSPCRETHSSLRFTTLTLGKGLWLTRSGMERRVYFPDLAFWTDSKEGVALPSKATALQIWARFTAASRAWYRGASSCL